MTSPAGHYYRDRSSVTDLMSDRYLKDPHAGVYVRGRSRCIPLDEIVAVKRCSLNFLDEAELEDLMAEAQIMAKYR